MMFFVGRCNSIMSKIILLSVAVTTFALSGCGGGGGGGSSSSTLVAQSSSVTTIEDTPVSDTLVATDSVAGKTLTYSIISNGLIGTATLTNSTTGAFTYTPNPNANGTDAFTYRASDGSSDSNAATVTVNITAVDDDPPVAQPGTLTTAEDMEVNATLNASDPDGNDLSYSIVTNGSKGVAVITDTATGAFTYTPNLNNNGSDIFTFTVNDGTTDSNEAIMAVEITPVNDAPIAFGSCSTTPQDQILTGTLAATDTETPGLLMFSLFADGSGGTGPITTAKGGTVTITDQTSGAFEYQPALSGDSRGTDSFAYQVSDPDGGANNAVETVIIDVKIMPFGDSITSGMVDGDNILPIIDERVGYRKPLFDLLTTNGFTFDFVGSRTVGQNLLSDADTESFGGYSAIQLAYGLTGFPVDGVRAWLTDNPADIVLIHAGTNSLNPNGQGDIEAILDEIDLWENSPGSNQVTVLLAMIIDQDPIEPDVAAFNNNVLTMAAARITDDILIVDQHGALNYPADLNDQLHPNTTGYNKMAGAWFDTLKTIVDKCP